jgi:hypothetical protein
MEFTLTTLDVLYSILSSSIVGYVTSFPPSIHSFVVKAYDYPVARMLVFMSVLVVAFYAPITSIIYGIGLAIISEDILKTSARVNVPTEQFVSNNEIDEIRKSLNIQVAKKMSPVEEALEKVKHVETLLRQNISSKND